MKIKKRMLKWIIVFILIIIGVFYFMPSGNNENAEEEPYWSVDNANHIYYPKYRGDIEFSRTTIEETNASLLSKVIFPSLGANIYGLLVLPKSVGGQMPGVVLLPGAGVSKESELYLANKISELGVAVLTIDQRGIGETGGKVPSFEEDMLVMSQGSQPVQHMMVHDALRAHDLLFSAPFINPKKIILVGESQGGRIAMIAAALDSDIEGVLAISSAGFDYKNEGSELQDKYVNSIDPDNYVDMISPRGLVMIHAVDDPIIPISSAATTYLKAEKPKRFAVINDSSCRHGYCEKMHIALLDSLNFLIGTENNLSEFGIEEN